MLSNKSWLLIRLGIQKETKKKENERTNERYDVLHSLQRKMSGKKRVSEVETVSL